MRSWQLLEEVQFHADRPRAEPLFVDPGGRALRFALRPGQSLQGRTTPTSPAFLIVLRGEGLFRGEEGERRLGPGSLIIYAPGEEHAVQALGEELIVVVLLGGVPGARARGLGDLVG